MARDQKKLHPFMQAKANELVAKCEEADLKIKITDCVRTKEEQNGIDASRTKAKYPKSYHNWGLAFDFCRNDGKGAYYDKDGFFTKVGRIGQELGLEWGGECFGKSLIDKPHFHTIKFGTYTRLTTWYRNPETYFKCWHLPTPQGPITPTSTREDIVWLQYALNEVMGAGLVVDGVFGSKTASAAVAYWKLMKWPCANKTGRYIGLGTVKSLAGKLQ